MIKAALIGYGYWGLVLLKNMNKNSKIKVVLVCDRNIEKIKKVKDNYKYIKTTNDSQVIIKNPEIDLVVIATQASTHYELTKKALLSNKHVFVEKPFTLDIEQAIELQKLAESRNLKIFVDHPHIFQNDHEKIKEILNKNELGMILNYHSTRADFGLFQKETNVIWHSLYHDIYIIRDLFPNEKIINIDAIASSHILKDVFDVASVSITFKSGLTADFYINFLFPEKERKIVISGSKKLVHWDYTRQEKIRIYDKTAYFNEKTKKFVYGDNNKHVSVDVTYNESIYSEFEHVVDCILNNKKSINGPDSAIEVMKILKRIEAAALKK